MYSNNVLVFLCDKLSIKHSIFNFKNGFGLQIRSNLYFKEVIRFYSSYNLIKITVVTWLQPNSRI